MLLASDYPPQLAISVFLDDEAFDLERADDSSLVRESNTNDGTVNDPEREFIKFKADIVVMNRRDLRH